MYKTLDLCRLNNVTALIRPQKYRQCPESMIHIRTPQQTSPTPPHQPETSQTGSSQTPELAVHCTQVPAQAQENREV